MKFQSALLALFVGAHVVSGFTVKGPLSSFGKTKLHSSLESIEAADDLGMFPLEITPMKRVEGGKTVLTYDFPPGSERCEVVYKTSGRPMKARAELWLGPRRTTHYLEMDVEDARKTPVRYVLKFRKGNPSLKISTKAAFEFPMSVGVRVASPERNDELAAVTEKLFDTSVKTVIQGGSVTGGGGAIRTFPIPNDVESVQMLCWSKNTGKKSFKTKVEVLQGPNNVKQNYELQCGGGSQPYHAVFQTPGEGAQLRVQNKKFLEDGLFQMVVVPYRMRPGAMPLPPDFCIVPNKREQVNPNSSAPLGYGSGKQWWE